MATATGITTKKSKKPMYIAIVVLVFVVAVAGMYMQSGPSRHDKQTQSDLNYIRMQIGKYVVANQAMPTIEQLNLPADMKARAAERHYTLAVVKDNSSQRGLFKQPTYDYRQCANFLTNTSDLPGDTNDTHHDYHLHHKGTHCFLNYAILNDTRVKP